MTLTAAGKKTPIRWSTSFGLGQNASKVAPGRDRRALWAVSAVLAAAVFLQRPGKIVFDTKLAMVTDPAKFMQQSLHLWDPLGSFGEIQNQAYGYLFPMGPFYALFHAIGMPGWITQRLWASVVMVVGLWGAVRLGEVLGIGNDTSRLIGGLAFAVSPFVASLGSVTYGVLPNTFTPLVLLPLISASRGQQSVVRGIARSSLAVLAMGGVNAASVLMVLFAPALWILTREPGPRRRKMMIWWPIGILMATFWWVVPLLFQGKYGFNFLPYTETASITNATTSATEVLRGAGFWLAYLDVNTPWLVGGWLVSTNVLAIVATIVVAGTSFFGLVRRDMKERTFFVGLLVIAVLILCIGYAGPFHGLVNGFAENLLNGPLAPLRNISKIEPLVSLVTAVGLMHALTVIKPSRFGGDLGRMISTGRILVCVVIGAGPLVVGNFYLAGGFSSIPSWWPQTADWIAAHATANNTLYVPGSAFGQYTWGNAQDEPIWSLANSPWAVRSIIPLGSKGSSLLLDAVDNVFQGGEAVPGLADYLALAGVKYVVVRNDLDTAATGAPSPLTVENVLNEEAGIKLVKSFGPYLPPTPPPKNRFNLGLEYLQSHLHEIDIFQVELPDTMVQMYPTSTGVVVSGDPGRSILQAEGAGLVGDRAIALAGDPLAPHFADPSWVDTDGNRNVDVDFGKLQNEYSYVLQPGELSPDTGKPPLQMSVVNGIDHMTVGKLVGVSGITASSYGSPIQRLPGYQPAFAFTDYPGYEWAATRPDPGSWIRVQFDSPVPLTQITITPDDTEKWRPHITQVQIATQGGTVTRNLTLESKPQTVSVPAVFTNWVKITISGLVPATQQPGAAGPAIEHISIPGVTVLPTMQLPSDEASQFAAPGSNSPSYLLSSPTPDPTDFLSPPDGDPHIARLFDVPQQTGFTIQGQATPLPSTGLIDALSGTGQIRVTASSTFSNLPWYRPANLIDGDPSTAWIAGFNDRDPTVTMSWPTAHTLSSVVVEPTSFLPGVTKLTIGSPAGNRTVAVPLTGGQVAIEPPLTTDQVTLSFPGNQGRSEPIGFAGLYFPDVENIAGLPPNPAGSFTMACGTAPPVMIDGQQYPTTMSGTWGDLLQLRNLSISVCGQPQAGIVLTPGEHLITVDDAGFPFKVTSLNILGSPPPAAASTRSVIVDSWNAETRVLTVGPGSDQEILSIRQNYSPGWVASLGGQRLQAVRLDGWQQGYIVPGGSGGTVLLSFAPDTLYRLSLLLGLFLVLALVGIALSPLHDPSGLPPTGPSSLPKSLLPFFAAVIVIGLIGGPILLVVPGLVYFRWKKASMGRIVFGALMGAGIIDALHPGKNPFAGPGPWIGLGPFSGPAQLLAVTAFAAVLVAVLPDEVVDEVARIGRGVAESLRRARARYRSP